MPPEGKWIPVLWRSYGDNADSTYSLPRLVEQRADVLKKRYLAWIYDLGESHVNGKRLIDHLELRPGFSYWWMTLISEKCNAYKSFHVIHVFKLLVLEELVAAHQVTRIILASRNKALVKTFRSWCHRAGLAFEWRPLEKQVESDHWIKRVYRSLPNLIQAFITLVHYVWKRWPLRKQTVGGGSEMTFVDYLIHLDQKALTTGKFASNFWTDLIDVLDQSGSKVNWLHHYIQHNAVASTKEARNVIARFNQCGVKGQSHSCLDSALSISAVFASLSDYSRLVWISRWLAGINTHFCPTGSKLDLWPLFKQEWFNSMRGPVAILNCLCLNLFERTIGNLPPQKLGVYLQENQGWEMGFIHAWRAAGHGTLIGVPHSTIRYWDLRYFFDPRSYRPTGKNALPLPDRVVLNGPAAMKCYQESAYPMDQIMEAEALRYLYLADMKEKRAKKPKALMSRRVLILGDYSAPITRQQMQWLTAAASLLPADTCYIIKSHPNCPVKESDYPSLHLQDLSLPLADLLHQCDVVYSSNITSGAVDAYCAGIPVVSMLDGNALNLSPLRGLRNVTYVTNHKELAQALRSVLECDDIDKVEPYFCLDRKMPRWKKCLESVSADPPLN